MIHQILGDYLPGMTAFLGFRLGLNFSFLVNLELFAYCLHGNMHILGYSTNVMEV
jgi:hypothetical protein